MIGPVATTKGTRNEGNPDTSNDADGIFGQSDGTTLLEPEQSGDGYAATFSIALAVS